MIIKANDYTSTTIAELMLEIRADQRVRNYMEGQQDMPELIEAAATHIIMTDTDYDTEEARVK